MLRAVLIAPIRFYQRFLSPMLPPACRFTPTCSEYTAQAIELYGWRGVIMGAQRLSRCHPFASGGYDPVPLPGALADGGCDGAGHDPPHAH